VREILGESISVSDCVALSLFVKQVEKKKGYYISSKQNEQKKGILCYYYVDIPLNLSSLSFSF